MVRILVVIHNLKCIILTKKVCKSNNQFVRFNSFSGSASAVARIGAMITPYIAQVLVDHSLFSAIGVYAVMGKIYDLLFL